MYSAVYVFVCYKKLKYQIFVGGDIMQMGVDEGFFLSHFISNFRKSVGTTPLVYRKNTYKDALGLTD